MPLSDNGKEIARKWAPLLVLPQGYKAFYRQFRRVIATHASELRDLGVDDYVAKTVSNFWDVEGSGKKMKKPEGYANLKQRVRRALGQLDNGGFDAVFSRRDTRPQNAPREDRRVKENPKKFSTFMCVIGGELYSWYKINAMKNGGKLPRDTIVDRLWDLAQKMTIGRDEHDLHEPLQGVPSTRRKAGKLVSKWMAHFRLTDRTINYQKQLSPEEQKIKLGCFWRNTARIERSAHTSLLSSCAADGLAFGTYPFAFRVAPMASAQVLACALTIRESRTCAGSPKAYPICIAKLRRGSKVAHFWMATLLRRFKKHALFDRVPLVVQISRKSDCETWAFN